MPPREANLPGRGHAETGERDVRSPGDSGVECELRENDLLLHQRRERDLDGSVAEPKKPRLLETRGVGDREVRKTDAAPEDTDVHAFQTPGPASPSTCGHEWTGTISAVGSDVSRVQEGDRVVRSGIQGALQVLTRYDDPQNPGSKLSKGR